MAELKRTPMKKPKLIYVYALVDGERFKRYPDIVREALYIGKGTGSRMSEHMSEVLTHLDSDQGSEGAPPSRKIKALMDAVKSGRKIKAIRISAGYLTDEDAFRAEALAITMINAYRSSSKKELLLNAVNGHHAQRIADMKEHFLYAQSEDEFLPTKPDEYAILVKTSDHESSDQHWAPLKKSFTHKKELIPMVTAMSPRRGKKARRAWDPLDPWSPEEAHDRAQRYWPFKTSTVVEWLAGEKNRPTWLFAGVPDGGDTVVRYAWRIDWGKNWQFFLMNSETGTGKWGIPVERPEELTLHPLLGRRLMEERTGKETQALAGYAHGVRVIGVRKVLKGAQQV